MTADQLAPGHIVTTPSGPARVRKVYRHATSPILIVRFESGRLSRFHKSERITVPTVHHSD